MNQSSSVCDWCTAGVCSSVYLVDGFELFIPAHGTRTGHVFNNVPGGWGACELCAGMIDRRDLPALILRSVRMISSRDTRVASNPLDQAYLHVELEYTYTALFEHMTDKLSLDDPRARALRAQPGASIGQVRKVRPDGSIQTTEVYALGPHPLAP